jgi:hypothetical protein
VRDEGRNDEESDGRKGTTRKYVRKEKKKGGSEFGFRRSGTISEGNK